MTLKKIVFTIWCTSSILLAMKRPMLTDAQWAQKEAKAALIKADTKLWPNSADTLINMYIALHPEEFAAKEVESIKAELLKSDAKLNDATLKQIKKDMRAFWQLKTQELENSYLDIHPELLPSTGFADERIALVALQEVINIFQAMIPASEAEKQQPRWRALGQIIKKLQEQEDALKKQVEYLRTHIPD